MRVFIAAEIPEATRPSLAALQRDLEREGARGVRWVDPAGIHLTLRFCGEIDAGQLERMRTRLAPGPPVTRFSVTLRGVGVFPPRGEPRVVWVGVDPEGSLDRLAGWVEDRVVESGLPAERRPFRVHLTLGRVRSERGHVPREALAARSEQVYGAVPVERIVVFESRLTPTGARYTPLDTVPLRPGEGPG